MLHLTSQDASRWGFAAGGGLFALWLARNELPSVPEVVWPWVLTASLLLLGLAVIAGLTYFLAPATRWTIQAADSLVTIHRTDYAFAPAQATDLPEVRELYLKQFPDDTPELATMQAWRARSDTAFWLVRAAGRSPLAGSFKILPLTRSGKKALVEGSATGTTFAPEHVASNRRGTVAYYVGDVVGKLSAKAAIVAHAQGLTHAWAKSHLPVYARALTDDGLRIMKKLGFVGVPGGGTTVKRQLAMLTPEALKSHERRSSTR